jgi:hypothetical protein
MENNGNGGGKFTDRLIIDFNRDTFAMAVGGQVFSHDVMLAMIEQAKRNIEKEVRKAQALELQKELAELARDRQIADEIQRNAQRSR